MIARLITGEKPKGKSHPDKVHNKTGIQVDVSIVHKAGEVPDLLDRYLLYFGMPGRRLQVR
jgi:hypothetical protein